MAGWSETSTPQGALITQCRWRFAVRVKVKPTGPIRQLRDVTRQAALVCFLMVSGEASSPRKPCSEQHAPPAVVCGVLGAPSGAIVEVNVGGGASWVKELQVLGRGAVLFVKTGPTATATTWPEFVAFLSDCGGARGWGGTKNK